MKRKLISTTLLTAIISLNPHFHHDTKSNRLPVCSAAKLVAHTEASNGIFAAFFHNGRFLYLIFFISKSKDILYTFMEKLSLRN